MDPEGDWEKGVASERLEALLMELGCWGFQESWCKWNCAPLHAGDLHWQRVEQAMALRAAQNLVSQIKHYIIDGCSGMIARMLENWWGRELEAVRRMCGQPDVDPDKYLGNAPELTLIQS